MAVDRQAPTERVFNLEQEVANIQSQYRISSFKKGLKYEFELTEFSVNGKSKKYLKAGGDKYEQEVELAYLLLDITNGPKYIAPKLVQKAFQQIGK
jgi:hypothetical protein